MSLSIDHTKYLVLRTRLFVSVGIQSFEKACEDGDIHKPTPSLELTYDETHLLLKKRYDGRHFVANIPGIYNPFSLLNTFKYMRPEDYWFEIRTSSYLAELLKHAYYDLYELANTKTDADMLNNVDSASSSPVPIIYQGGYLAIKDYDPRFGTYKLGSPSLEIEEGFVKYLLPFCTSVSAPKTPFEIGRLVREVE